MCWSYFSKIHRKNLLRLYYLFIFLQEIPFKRANKMLTLFDFLIQKEPDYWTLLKCISSYFILET